VNEDKVQETTQDKTQAAINRGLRAAQLLESEAFKDATDALAEQLMDRWRVSADQIERERIWLSVNLLDQIKGKLAIVANNGKLARKELDELTTGRRLRFGIV
jgi:hypothetical protein